MKQRSSNRSTRVKTVKVGVVEELQESITQGDVVPGGGERERERKSEQWPSAKSVACLTDHKSKDLPTDGKYRGVQLPLLRYSTSILIVGIWFLKQLETRLANIVISEPRQEGISDSPANKQRRVTP